MNTALRALIVLGLVLTSAQALAHTSPRVRTRSLDVTTTIETDCRVKVWADRYERWNVSSDGKTYFRGQSEITVTYLNTETDELVTYAEQWGWRTWYRGKGEDSWSSDRWVEHPCFDKTDWVVFDATWEVIHSHRDG